jgi:hypothetical protein
MSLDLRNVEELISNKSVLDFFSHLNIDQGFLDEARTDGTLVPVCENAEDPGIVYYKWVDVINLCGDVGQGNPTVLNTYAKPDETSPKMSASPEGANEIFNELPDTPEIPEKLLKSRKKLDKKGGLKPIRIINRKSEGLTEVQTQYGQSILIEHGFEVILNFTENNELFVTFRS